MVAHCAFSIHEKGVASIKMPILQPLRGFQCEGSKPDVDLALVWFSEQTSLAAQTRAEVVGCVVENCCSALSVAGADWHGRVSTGVVLNACVRLRKHVISANQAYLVAELVNAWIVHR